MLSFQSHLRSCNNEDFIKACHEIVNYNSNSSKACELADELIINRLLESVEKRDLDGFSFILEEWKAPLGLKFVVSAIAEKLDTKMAEKFMEYIDDEDMEVEDY